jgi:hypothetical protein
LWTALAGGGSTLRFRGNPSSGDIAAILVALALAARIDP